MKDTWLFFPNIKTNHLFALEIFVWDSVIYFCGFLRSILTAFIYYCQRSPIMYVSFYSNYIVNYFPHKSHFSVFLLFSLRCKFPNYMPIFSTKKISIVINLRSMILMIFNLMDVRFAMYLIWTVNSLLAVYKM